MKLSDEGLSEMVGAFETTKVTLTTWEVAPLAATVTVPLYVAAVNPEGFTETLTNPGVRLETGLIASLAQDFRWNS